MQNWTIVFEYSVGGLGWRAVLEVRVGEQRVWRIRLPNAQSQLRELSARARSAVFVLARFRSPCVGIDMGGCAWRVGSMCSPRPRYWGFGGRTYVLDWSCPRNWRFGGEMAVRGDEL